MCVADSAFDVSPRRSVSTSLTIGGPRRRHKCQDLLPPAAAPTAAPTPAAPLAMEDIIKTIERLAELRQKNILTEEEFVAKKAELLGRL